MRDGSALGRETSRMGLMTRRRANAPAYWAGAGRAFMAAFTCSMVSATAFF